MLFLGFFYIWLWIVFGKFCCGSICVDVDVVDWSRNLLVLIGIVIYVYSDYR